MVVLGPKMGQRNKKTLCDPPYDFRDKGDNMLTTRFHLKTKEIFKSRLYTLTKHTRAHLNYAMLLSHIINRLKTIKRASIK